VVVALRANRVSSVTAPIAAATTKRANGAFGSHFCLSTDTRASPNPLFLLNQNNGLQGAKSGSSIPLNVLDGHRWLNAVPVDRDVLRKVIRAELGST
jgi:hypothetical protein